MTMQRDLRPPCLGQSRSGPDQGFDPIFAVPPPFVHGQLQSSLRHIGFYGAGGRMESIYIVRQGRALVYIIKGPVVIKLVM
jgi:hypothetical protein